MSVAPTPNDSGKLPGEPTVARARAVVAVRERREDPGRDPRAHVLEELGGVGRVRAPRVVDHVGRLGGIAARREHPLEAVVDDARGGRAGVAEDLDRDPLGVGRDADDLARRAADDRAHHVRAVAVPVCRLARSSRRWRRTSSSSWRRYGRASGSRPRDGRRRRPSPSSRRRRPCP